MEETVRLVPSFVTVTLAFAIAAPVGSVTVPVNWPFCTCANALRVRASTAKTTRQSCNLFIYLPPGNCDALMVVVLHGDFCLRTRSSKLLLQGVTASPANPEAPNFSPRNAAPVYLSC